MANDISFKNDEALQVLLEMISQVLSQLIKTGEHGTIMFLNGVIAQLDSYIKNTQG